ncbi:MAG: PqqD family protein [Deltaproteobacteria bacterium]|nr:PqqD family protein [Deltaproteobacteria bacterium]
MPPATIDLLDMIPRRLVGHVPGDDGLVIVVAPRFKSDFWREFARRFGIKPFVHVRLDRIGSAAWQAIDGQRTLREVVTVMEGELGPTPELHERLARFVLDLRRNDLLALAEPSREASTDSG